MDNNTEEKSRENVSVPYIIYEGEMARNERHIRRLIIALIVSISIILFSNLAWLKAWTMYDYSSDETIIDASADDGGNVNYVGNDGDIVNGTIESNQENAQENT